jgi:hypothetical protein
LYRSTRDPAGRLDWSHRPGSHRPPRPERPHALRPRSAAGAPPAGGSPPTPAHERQRHACRPRGYIRTWTGSRTSPPSAHPTRARRAPRLCSRVEHEWSRAVATSANQWQMGTPTSGRARGLVDRCRG